MLCVVRRCGDARLQKRGWNIFREEFSCVMGGLLIYKYSMYIPGMYTSSWKHEKIVELLRHSMALDVRHKHKYTRENTASIECACSGISGISTLLDLIYSCCMRKDETSTEMSTQILPWEKVARCWYSIIVEKPKTQGTHRNSETFGSLLCGIAECQIRSITWGFWGEECSNNRFNESSTSHSKVLERRAERIYITP